MKARKIKDIFPFKAALLTSVLSSPFAAPALAENEDAPLRPEADVDAIVVLGERQARSLLDTASSVEIFDEDDLKRESGQAINEVVQSAANTLVRTISEAPIIRGVEGGGPGGLANTGLAGTQPRIPLIIDEIARPATIANADFNTIWDLERIEVLKGAQTSLRGRSAIGGAIIARTNDPTFEPEAALQGVTEFDDFHGATYALNAMASGGVIEDRLALRATAEYEAGDDPRTIIGVLPGQEDKVDALTEFEQLRLRGKALFTPQGEAGPLRILGIIEYQEGITPQTRGTVLSADIDRREMLFTGGLRLFDTEAIVGGLDAAYEFDDGGVLRAITSYGVSEFASRAEQPVAPVPQNFFFDFTETIFNQDLIYAFSETGWAKGLVGATYTRRTQDFGIVNEVPPLPSGQLRSNADGRQETYSLFADLRFPLTDRVELTAGGRILHEDQRRETFLGLLALPSPPFPISVPPAMQDFDRSETVALPSVGLQFAISPRQTLALTARRGWNSGGAAIQLASAQPFTFESESVWTYEATYRFVSDDQRTSLSATAFYSDQNNPQFFLQTVPGALASTLVVNLPGAESYGLELEAKTTVFDTLALFGNLGLLETEVTESIATRPDLLGNRIGKDPDVTLSAGFVWTPRFAEGVAADGRVSYIGAFFNNFNNLPNEDIGDYALIDFGVSYRFRDIEARAFVNNAADEAGVNSLVTQFAEVTPPRTFGVSLTARF